jgi:capsular polysaccharide export protein
MVLQSPPRFFCIGFRRWKAANLKPIISLHPERVFFLNTLASLHKHHVQANDMVIVWGATHDEAYEKFAKSVGARFLRIEDGFVRSVGLGSDLIKPSSIIFDEKGIYFDASKPSDLEDILNRGCFSDEDLRRAENIRQTIVAHHITKYNIDHIRQFEMTHAGKKIILVPGQVEDDASIKLGGGEIRTNFELLRRVRAIYPHDFLLYKPHPDVLSGNRKGGLSLSKALLFADHVELKHSVLDCIAVCDEVHTMTSLTGFDALLRGKKVVTYGQPFYAGWGLTQDMYLQGEAFKRRTRKLNINQLVAGALIHYPIYWDWDLRGYTTCEAVLLFLAKQRDALIATGQLDKLRVGFIRRQLRKLNILLASYVA